MKHALFTLSKQLAEMKKQEGLRHMWQDAFESNHTDRPPKEQLKAESALTYAVYELRQWMADVDSYEQDILQTAQFQLGREVG